jgi:dGTPase
MENFNLLPNLRKIKKINFYKQSSLESQISALSDDIAYNNHDIDDGIRAGLFSINDVKDLPIIGEIIKKKNKQFKNTKLLRNEIIRSIINFMVTDLILHTQNNLKKLKIKTIEDVYKTSDFIVSFSPKLINANNQIREFLRLNMYENKSVKVMTSKAEKIIKTLYIYLINNNKKFIPKDLKKKWGLERSVSDFIAGMTDKFAIDLYNKIK